MIVSVALASGDRVAASPTGKPINASPFSLNVAQRKAAQGSRRAHTPRAACARSSRTSRLTPRQSAASTARCPGRASSRATNNYVGRVGISISYAVVDQTTAQIQSELAQLRAGGVSWVREDFSWALAEPERGVFNWAPLDRLMEAASRARVQVLGILDYSALWASSDPTGRGDIFYPPKNDADFADYSAAVVSRYGSEGIFWGLHPDLTPDHLGAVEIWNEPFGDWFWKPGPDPAAYAALVRRTAPALHAADPNIKVIMSGDLQSWDDRYKQHTAPWIARVLHSDPGVAKLVDALGVHPYPEPRNLGPYDNGPDLRESFGRIPLIRQTELKAGVTLPLWITEVGWSTAPNTPLSISSQTQATYMRDAIRRTISDWGSYVQKTFLFGWYRSSGKQGDAEHNYGLLDNSGVPKPSWTVITQLLGGQPASQACPGCPDAT